MKTLRNTLLGLLVTLVLIVLPSAVFARGGGNYSGDDRYDPAAYGLSAPTAEFVMNFSGDDVYDLAAAGQPAETSTRHANRFSGDDAYDPTFDTTSSPALVALLTVR